MACFSLLHHSRHTRSWSSIDASRCLLHEKRAYITAVFGIMCTTSFHGWSGLRPCGERCTALTRVGRLFYCFAGNVSARLLATDIKALRRFLVRFAPKSPQPMRVRKCSSAPRHPLRRSREQLANSALEITSKLRRCIHVGACVSQLVILVSAVFEVAEHICGLFFGLTRNAAAGL